jgi:hypothetical protein
LEDPGTLLGLALMAVTLAVVAAVLAPRMLRPVAQNERMVVFRAGRTNLASVRGPGRTLLLPLIDSGDLVSLAPQRLTLESIPVRAADGAGVVVDVEAEFRVVDPLQFALAVIPPPAVGVRLMAKKILQDAANGLDPADAQDPGRLEQAMGRTLEDVLGLAGATDRRVRVLRARAAVVTEAEELVVMGRLGFRGGERNRDYAGSRTAAGDLRWGLGRIRRMALYSMVSVPLVTSVILVFVPFGRPSLTATNFLFGIMIGMMIGALADMPDGAEVFDRRLGWRRTIVWWLVWIVWTTAAVGAVLLGAVAAGMR